MVNDEVHLAGTWQAYSTNVVGSWASKLIQPMIAKPLSVARKTRPMACQTNVGVKYLSPFAREARNQESSATSDRTSHLRMNAIKSGAEMNPHSRRPIVSASTYPAKNITKNTPKSHRYELPTWNLSNRIYRLHRFQRDGCSRAGSSWFLWILSWSGLNCLSYRWED